MFRVYSYEALEANPDLKSQMLRHRKRQFVDRLHWQLQTNPEGLEVDEYDIPGTFYCVVERDGNHLGSLRLRLPEEGTMTADVFNTLWQQCTSKLAGAIEVTRFCVAPGLPPAEQPMIVGELLLGLCRHCLRVGITSVYGVVYPSVAKVVRAAGWEGTQLAIEQRGDERLVLAEWAVDELVTWSIQEKAARIVDRRRQRERVSEAA